MYRICKKYKEVKILYNTSDFFFPNWSDSIEIGIWRRNTELDFQDDDVNSFDFILPYQRRLLPDHPDK